MNTSFSNKLTSCSFFSKAPTSGGTAHLGMEMFKSLSKTNVLHVPYKGSSGAVNDLISGEVSAMFSSLPSLQGLADKGHGHDFAWL